MLSFMQNIIKKTQAEKEGCEIKPLTIAFWSDFMANPAVMYELFSPTPRKLNYDHERVKVMGTKDGMISQINVRSIEDLDSIRDELMGSLLLLRIYVEFIQNVYTGVQTELPWEGDLALLVDTSHPMIRPEIERGLDRTRRIIQAGGNFCLEINFGPAIDDWLRKNYPRGCCTVGNVRRHKAALYITNYVQPITCFRCNALWCLLFAPCWLLSAPCYKAYRHFRSTDIEVRPQTTVVRRGIMPSGKIIEVSR